MKKLKFYLLTVILIIIFTISGYMNGYKMGYDAGIANEQDKIYYEGFMDGFNDCLKNKKNCL